MAAVSKDIFARFLDRPVQFKGAAYEKRMAELEVALAATELIEGKIPDTFKTVMELYASGRTSLDESISLCRDIPQSPISTPGPSV